MYHLAEQTQQSALDHGPNVVPLYVNLPLVTDEDIERAELQEHAA